jgi:methionyl-tRNA formyltransferase
MNIVFMGTPEFSVPSLKKMIKKHNVIAVVTQPDRPKGRGKKLSMSPVKVEGLSHNIPILQPEKLKGNDEIIQILKNMHPDFIIVVAFGQILPEEVINIPKYGCINLHASLLPKYRGAAPINWAIINGENETGNTTMFMDKGLDTGDILLRSKVVITSDMNAAKLEEILSNQGGDLLLDTIKGVANSGIKRTKQGEMQTEYAKMLDKKTAEINWNQSSKKICCLVRGLNPRPVAFTKINGDVMKIYNVVEIEEKRSVEPGFVIEVSKDGIKVATQDGSVLIKVVQFAGGKELKVEEYIKGHTIDEAIVLGI